MIDQLYQQLTPQLKQIEKVRISYLFFKKLAAACMVIVLPLSVVYPIAIQFIVSYWPQDKMPPNMLGLMSPLFFLSVILIFTYILSRLYARKLYDVISNTQQKIFSVITKAVCPEFNVIEKMISNEELTDTGFFKNENNAPLFTLSEGTICGEIDGIKCELWDVNVITNKYNRFLNVPIIGFVFIVINFFRSSLKSLSPTNNLYDQEFKGLIIKLDLYRPLSSWTLVLPNTWEQKIPFINKIFQRLNDEEKNVVDLIDTDFNKKFTVYSSDQVEARYILTPTFMERISEWQERLQRPLFLSFNKKYMYIAIIDPEGIFDIPLARSVLSPVYIKKPFDDLRIYTKIIEEFNADKKIWYKPHLV